MSNKLLINSKFIEIQCDRDDIATRELAFQIPYVHYNRIYTSFKTSIRNIELVLKLFRNIGEFDSHKLPVDVQTIYNTEIERKTETKILLEQGARRYNNEHWLYKHQQLGRELAQVNSRFGFFYDTRTGKTPMSLQIIADDIAMYPTHKWLVLCPLILIENAWLPDAATFFQHLQILNLHHTNRQKRVELFKQDAQVYVTNLESFINYEEQIRSLNIYGCFVDESSAMKAAQTKISKGLVDYSQSLKKWYLLSGVPAPNGEWEYYRQLQSIDLCGVHDSYTKFKNYFFNNVSNNPQYEKLCAKPERKHELQKIIKDYSLYVDKEQVLVTPGRDFIELQFELPEELKEVYKTMKNEMLYEISDENSLTAMGAAAMLNKLNQITSGFIIDTHAKERNRIRRENGIVDEPVEEELYNLSNYRFNFLYKHLELIGNKQVIIWANYRNEFKIIKEHLGSNCACIYGETNIAEKNENIKNFKAGKFQYLICNPASADKGLTLTNCHVAIYFSLNYSLETYKQSMERIYGSINSQPNRCTYYILIAKGTVNRLIYSALNSKMDMAMEMLNHLKAESL